VPGTYAPDTGGATVEHRRSKRNRDAGLVSRCLQKSVTFAPIKLTKAEQERRSGARTRPRLGPADLPRFVLEGAV